MMPMIDGSSITSLLCTPKTELFFAVVLGEKNENLKFLDVRMSRLTLDRVFSFVACLSAMRAAVSDHLLLRQSRDVKNLKSNQSEAREHSSQDSSGRRRGGDV
jgi:hypothetical protein